MPVKALKRLSAPRRTITLTEAVSALSALAQETRLSLFRYLVTAGDPVPAGHIAEALAVPAPTLSFHLKELERAGLITSKRESRLIRYGANYAGMRGLIEFLTHDCCRGHPDVCVTGDLSTDSPDCRKSGC